MIFITKMKFSKMYQLSLDDKFIFKIILNVSSVCGDKQQDNFHCTKICPTYILIEHICFTNSMNEMY